MSTSVYSSTARYTAAIMTRNSTSPGADLGRPQFESHKWLEPIIVVSIMIGSLIINRDRDFTISKQPQRVQRKPLLADDYDSDCDDLDQEDRHIPSTSGTSNSRNQPKNRDCCGYTVRTPNTDRFRNHWHSQFLQKFPFLIEMFYWALNYAVYSFTKVLAERFYDGKGNGVVELAQSHGVSILKFEHDSFARFFFPIPEVDVQRFFLVNGHTSLMTILNRAYSLVHIPGTVLFLSWYYFAAPNHDTFALARRTMTLANFGAFLGFTLWPCMPPRLLPESFGFRDTVRQDKAESVWVGGKNVNQLAAMPSLHFTYAFVIGSTFLYHSRRLHMAWKLAFIVTAVIYPLFVLLVIVSTANHYYLDAVVATFSVAISFLCNRVWFVFLPAEDWLCWILRLEKPVPTTGMMVKKQKKWSRDVV